ncbi:hypothetical protein IP91_02206 [Pseudoduganella lurida]|uniref:Cell envelope biogenesis protein TolA n=1 Tax=Pseudoduganella lurida TaxID=1036180 RepID=A0A562RBE4_9BURK|nr:hypothetical protein [Pseudoduganella lurida]TWI66392.1 hypothetical protein IP91_02206 [Pseudoduganella lurida]
MALHFNVSKIARGLLALFCTLACTLSCAVAYAEPVQTVQTVEQADAALLQVKAARAAVESEFADSEKVCYAKFFVNNCLDKAKELRRVRLAELRATEIDANYFKRKNAVEVRDRELEERAQRDAAEEAANAKNPPKPRPNPADRAAPVPLRKLPAQRAAEHEARVQKQAAEDAAKAGERAKNVEEAKARQAESLERQKRVAEKAAERAARQARRAADAAAKEAAAAEKAKQKALQK